jgi:hypothetical protein
MTPTTMNAMPSVRCINVAPEASLRLSYLKTASPH